MRHEQRRELQEISRTVYFVGEIEREDICAKVLRQQIKDAEELIERTRAKLEVTTKRLRALRQGEQNG